jgi:hypothetical protein
MAKNQKVRKKLFFSEWFYFLQSIFNR